MANQQTKRATLWVKDGWIFCRTPYSESFIDDLKNEVPHHARKWDREEKVWKVEASFAEDLETIVRRYFGEPTVVQQEVLVVAQGAGGDAYSDMLSAAPDDLLKKIHAMIVSKVHPDAGGSTEAMTKVNVAWAEIKKKRGL
jgi:hypothetical protein